MSIETKRPFNVTNCNNTDIYFLGSICTESMMELVKELKLCEAKILSPDNYRDLFDPYIAPIRLHIYSSGGYTFDAYFAVDQIRMLRVPVHTIVCGSACSAATILSCVGKRRFITKNAYMLIHAPCIKLQPIPDGQIKQGHYNGIDYNAHLINHYVTYTKMTRESLEELFSMPDRYFNAEECLEKGLIDEII